MTQQTVFSAIQPSGALTLAHYIGALQHWQTLRQSHQCYFAVADLHAITTTQNPQALMQASLDVLAWYCVLDFDKPNVSLFIQSQVTGHAQLGWCLGCLTHMGELSRMTQYKDKSNQHAEKVGLFTYPVLQAADILLYDTQFVPVGADQKQHLELTRDLAQRFNHHYGPSLTVPKPLIADHGARLMSLQDPSKKMSKSDPNLMGTLFLLDTPDQVVKKVMRAVTDAHARVLYDVNNQPGVSNLLTIFSTLSGHSIQSLVTHYDNQGYGQFKNDLAECINTFLAPLQARYQAVRSDEFMLYSIARRGHESAQAKARSTLERVHQALGLVRSVDD